MSNNDNNSKPRIGAWYLNLYASVTPLGGMSLDSVNPTVVFGPYANQVQARSYMNTAFARETLPKVDRSGQPIFWSNRAFYKQFNEAT